MFLGVFVKCSKKDSENVTKCHGLKMREVGVRKNRTTKVAECTKKADG